MTTDKMLATKEGPVGRMIFNNPERHNAVSLAMWQAASSILDDFANDSAVRVIVVSGAGGKSFVSGADISKFDSERASRDAVAEYNGQTAAVYAKLEQMSKPTIAQINGYCIGGGLNLAACCDLRICTEKSQFALPAAKLGLGYPMSSLQRLANAVGLTNAKEICFTGTRISAAHAKTMGLISHIVAVEEIEQFVSDYAAGIAANAPLTVTSMKQIFTEMAKNPDQQDSQRCQALVDACFSSNDYVEGRNAFMEKRTPAFQGS